MKMSKILCVLMALLIAVGALSVSVSADTNATVDMSSTHQTIDGWGASYTWYADWLLNHNNADLAYDWIFNDTEFNIIRLRDLNLCGDEHQNAVDGYPAYKKLYDAAVARGIEPTVLVTSWGQYDRDLPWVAFTELSAKGFSYYTLAKDENGEYMYDALAQHCVESIKYFFDAGIPVHYFSISNEIELQERHVDENGKARQEAGFFLGMEETDDYCCYWKAHIAVYEAFKEAFGEFAPVLLGAETMGGYGDLLQGYLEPVIENCPESLEIMGHHLYGTDLSPNNFSKIRAAYPDYPIWQTEWYTDDYFGLANIIIDELNYEDLNAYLFWNGAWAPDRGVTLVEIADAGENADLTRGGNHYIMMHFSKYIKEGYIRVDINEDLESNMTAFKSPDGKKLVVVAVNLSDSNEYLALDVGEEILGSVTYQSLKADNRFRNKYWLEAGKYSEDYELPAGSLTTIVLDLAGDPNYVAPVEADEPVNPFINTRAGKPGPSIATIIIIAAVAVVAVVAVILIIAVFSMKKKAKTDSKTEPKTE